MNATQKLVLISLADQANDQGVCWPSLANMERRTNLSERAIRAAIRWLEAASILTTTYRQGTSSSYTIDVTTYNPDAPRQLVLPGTTCRPPRREMPGGGAAGAGEGGTTCPQTINEPSIEPSGEPSIGRKAEPAGKKRSRDEDPKGFAEAWDAYPKRRGDNPRLKAVSAWRARLAEGADPQAMLEGTLRYAEFCRLTGKSGTEYVKQASTFYGPQKGFLEAWDASPSPGGLPPTTGLRKPADPATSGFASAEDFLNDDDR